LKTLILAAHPDDEVLGMGGTIKKLTKEGNVVKIVIMATGLAARRSTTFKNNSLYHISKKTSEKITIQIESLRRDSKKACKILGVTDVEFMNFLDNEMDKSSNLEITKSIENIIKIFKPERIFTHSPYDVNVDHRSIYHATLTATRPNSSYSVPEVISFEVPSSTEWYFPNNFQPNIFIDISKELKFKLNALKAYKTEIKKFPHPRSIEGLEHVSKRWGTVSGFKAAEAFSLVRKLQK
jgi:LmbE family N-acetylglucosaminyl deacetylase